MSLAKARAASVPHRWRNLGSLIGATVAGTVLTGLITLLFPSIAATLRLTNTDLGVLVASGRVVSIPMGPVWVWLSTRLGRRVVVAGGTVAGGVAGIVGGLSEGFAVLVTANVLMAAFTIAVAPLAQAVISDSFDDRHRSRAVGYLYGVTVVLTSALGPAAALFTSGPDGWRTAFLVVGVIDVAVGVAFALLFRDPGIGAAEQQLADLSEAKRVRPVTVGGVLSLWKVPTFSILMASRLLSGHLLLTLFGVQFLVSERGFDNATAASVLVPYGIGYGLGAVGGGWLVAGLDRVSPRHGRVALLQVAQLGFAGAAFLGTQRVYTSLAPYAVFTGLMGLTQALNPGANRPVIMSVVLPELRGQAFAIFFSVVDTLAVAGFSLAAGILADRVGLTTVFLWVLVVLMVANAVWLSLLHVTYPRDSAQVTRTLERRRSAAIES